MKKRLLFRAKYMNWSLHDPSHGWQSTTWEIYRNGAFSRVDDHGLRSNYMGDSSSKPEKELIHSDGEMSKKDFKALKKFIENEFPKYPKTLMNVGMSDGCGWEFISFDKAGNEIHRFCGYTIFNIRLSWLSGLIGKYPVITERKKMEHMSNMLRIDDKIVQPVQLPIKPTGLKPADTLFGKDGLNQDFSDSITLLAGIPVYDDDIVTIAIKYQGKNGVKQDCIRVTERSGTLVGRSSECDVVVDENCISRKQFRFLMNANDRKIYIENLGKTNTAYINGTPFIGTRMLMGEEEIRVGYVTFWIDRF